MRVFIGLKIFVATPRRRALRSGEECLCSSVNPSHSNEHVNPLVTVLAPFGIPKKTHKLIKNKQK